MVARDHHDDRVGKHLNETRELFVRVKNCRIGRANIVEHVTGNEHDVRLRLDRAIDHLAKSDRDVCFALIDSRGCLPLILTIAEVDVGEMNDFHRDAVTFKVCTTRV